MNKKLIVISLLSLSFFMVGCTNNNEVKNTSANVSTQSNKAPQTQQLNNTDTTKNSTDSQGKAGGNSSSENKGTTQNSNQAAEVYQLNSNVYKNQNITINYPQITGLGDSNKQSVINELIKNDVVSYVNKNIAGDSNLTLNYIVKLQASDLLSIQYSGVASRSNSAHPSNIFYTTNIDVKNGKKPRLSDFVQVNQDLVKAFKKGQYVNFQSRYSKEQQAEIVKYVNDNISANNLIKYFNEADSLDIENVNTSSTFSYLTKDSIVISVNVPHALGDHAEFSINYKNIQRNINAKDSVLKSLIN